MFKRIRTKAGLLFSLSLFLACNGVTGVNDLEVDKPDGGSHPKLESLVTIPGIAMTDISLYQGVKAQLMADGAPFANTVPIIAGRDALMRIFVATDASYTGQPVTARLFLEGRTLPFEITTSALPAASSEDKLETTINIPIPGAAISTFTSYKVLLGRPSGPIPLPSTSVIYPATGWDTITGHSDGAGLKLVLVPIQYGADSSDRVPDLSDAILKGYADGFRAIYPIPDIAISVHDPMPWAQPVAPDGTGWGELLDAITSLRQTDSAAFDVYYFGVFQPAASFGQYCGGGCVLGLGNLASSPQDSGHRAAIGCAFGDPDSIETAVHEIGHTHGRQHAPSCGAAGPDPSYPYPDGKDGTLWGYNLITGKLYDPAIYYDFMGYCMPNWISDYNFNKLYEQIRDVNMAARVEVPAELRDRTYDRVLIDGVGGMKWMPPLKMAQPPRGEERTVVIESSPADQTITAQFYPFDHLPGGTLMWPSTGRAASAVRFEHQGKTQRIPAP